MKHLLFGLGLVFLFASCAQQPQASSTSNDQSTTTQQQPVQQSRVPATQQAFFTELSKLCGTSFRGTTVFPADDKDPFAGKELTMHVQVCSDTTIRIPFHVGEDKSRTWVIRKMQEGLQLKHDHRHKDGTPDEITMYGGIALASDNASEMRFPADAHTAQLIPAASTNEWTLLLSPDGKTFSYILKRDNQLRFRADFDLTKPLN
ncbi:hypothetical protein H9Q13_17265 [Pontibacter sp. JH31]|uniref:Secreted protein n=1 Tax=Pontibacter aquaedesilientis TaxID=2766980 RepID=A0ABR7XMP9_9BACT|nr:hypothetical protein [Pontibacter aquaedesilientis]MBD1398923.1 hypothetical protein [Pontibacter aquaedesilientis]